MPRKTKKIEPEAEQEQVESPLPESENTDQQEQENPQPEVETPEVEVPSPETQEQDTQTQPQDSQTESESTEAPQPLPEVDSNENTEQGGDSPQENTESENTDQQEQDTQTQPQEPNLELEPLPPLPEPTPLPDTPTTPTLPNDENIEAENIEQDFTNKLENALSQQASWKEQVYITLQGLSMLLSRFNTIKDILSKSHNHIITNKQDIDNKKQNLDAQYSHLLQTLQLYQIYFNDLKRALSVNANIIVKNMQVCIQQALLCEQTLTETKGVSADILEYRSDILLTLEKLKALETQKQELLLIYAQGREFLQEVKLTQEAILKSLTQKYDEIKAELSTHKGELHTELIQAKEALEANLREQENQALEHIESKISFVDEKITELEQNFINKKAQLDLAHSELTNARTALQEAKDEFETKANECERKLQELTDNHSITLSNAKDSHIIALNEAHSTHSQNLEELKTNYKQELDSVCAGEIAILKKYIEQIQARTTQFGANFKRITYLQNETFTPTADNIYYYVFLQGGSGVDNSTTQGGITSFGSYLSARGGKGGENGKGMRGECVSGFVEITELTPIEVSVGEGGICIISYTTKEAQ